MSGDGTVRRRVVAWLLRALLLWCFALRVWMASVELNGSRFWDERFGLRNIGSLVRDGELRPENGFHPSLSYLPQAALLAASHGLHRLTGAPIFAVFAGADRYTPTAYFLCRATQALASAASLGLLFWLGRSLFSPAVGLLAAFLLSVVPWHLRQGAIFKPDMLLLLTCLLAMGLTLRAVERPSLRRYVAAGAAIGLALSSKFNAGPIALPLAAASLWTARGRRWPSLAWLALAGATAAILFLLLNPYLVLAPELYQEDFSKTLRDYGRKGVELGGGSHLYQLVHLAESLLSVEFHGRAIGLLGLAGLAAMLTLAARERRRPETAVRWLLVPSYVLGYAALYAASTTNPSAHNWLPLVPYTALAAAWLLAELAAAARRAWRPWRRLRLGAFAAAGLVAGQGYRVMTYAYESIVPTNAALAERLLVRRLGGPAGRVILQEDEVPPLVVRCGREKAVVMAVPRLIDVAATRLDRADAEVFPAARLDGATAPAYAPRLARQRPQDVRWFESRWLRARGADLVVLVHPWIRGGPGIVLEARRRARGRTLAALTPVEVDRHRVFSVGIWLPPGSSGRVPAEVAGQPVDLGFTRAGAQGSYYQSERFLRPPGAGRELVLKLGDGSGPAAVGGRVDLFAWRQGARPHRGRLAPGGP